MGVAEDHRPPGAEVVEIAVAVGVPEISALGADEEWRRAADGAKGADGGIDSAGKKALGAELEFVGLGERAGHLIPV